jgi:hypothetical protein
MKNLQVITFFTLLVLQISCNRNNDLKETSKKICECFKNYSEDDLNTMNTSVHLIDSLKLDLGNMSKHLLISQLKKYCPKTALVIEKLAD